MLSKGTRRRRATEAVLLAMLLGGCGAPAGAHPTTPAAGQPRKEAARAPAARLSRSPVAAISYPATGRNRWSTAAAEAPTRPGRGQLLRYRVAVERDITGLPVADVAAAVTATLNDPRGWTAGGSWQLRRVGLDQPADFTIYLATPGTRDKLCQDIPDGYTSCRNANRVVLNVARWVKGVPGYGASVNTYRQYMVNHEVGHRLGLGHERCPGPGQPAPVMQQQTLGLHGCTANAWPYRDGRRYRGPLGEYDDELPPREGARRAA
ncbi:uncharacterized protein DUF3152 [Asanoa ferruginea]|uniref:Uncharacterized protein DUF3152 n=1 Tax=Asanoa ferruginea TaxID=53367 RepID=A0A3D9ZUV1_9ACTN|nr:DUF3152 domain-containing protein [Asanoa ferruginea]REG01117.1 uncharacterized protein DUF3152 [Asanoa ferruginea]GIF47183.1 lipoprotein [Asanoa ferruginea]